MFKMTTRKWKKLLVWVAGYANLLTFALVGGYFMLKDEDEEVKYSIKWAFLANLVFLAFTAFLSFVSSIGGACNWYGSWIYKVYSGLSLINNIGRIAVFVTCALFAVFWEKPWSKCACKEVENTATETEQGKTEQEDGKEDTQVQNAEESVKTEQKSSTTTRSEKVREFFNIIYDVLHGRKKEEEIVEYLKNEDAMRSDLKQACALTEENGKGSISLLQRKMKTGYAYAGSIIEGFTLIGVVKKETPNGNAMVQVETMNYLKKYL